MREDFQHWDSESLKERLLLVWDFDQACESAAAGFVNFARSHRVEKREILVPRKVKVAVPRE